MAPQVLQELRASDAHIVVASETFVRIAERELKAALLVHERPMAGMYAQPSPIADSALHGAVRALCTEARRLDLRAEEMLIGIKQAWAHLAATRAAHLGDRDGDVLQHVVTSSIEAYFEQPAAALKDRSRD
jgi:hypothetical protein